MLISQQLPRNDVVWKHTGTNANSSSAGGSVRTKQGRTLAARPRSACQISALCATGIVFLQPVENLHRLVSEVIANIQRLAVGLQFHDLGRKHSPLGQ